VDDGTKCAVRRNTVELTYRHNQPDLRRWSSAVQGIGAVGVSAPPPPYCVAQSAAIVKMVISKVLMVDPRMLDSAERDAICGLSQARVWDHFEADLAKLRAQLTDGVVAVEAFDRYAGIANQAPMMWTRVSYTAAAAAGGSLKWSAARRALQAFAESMAKAAACNPFVEACRCRFTLRLPSFGAARRIRVHVRADANSARLPAFVRIREAVEPVYITAEHQNAFRNHCYHIVIARLTQLLGVLRGTPAGAHAGAHPSVRRPLRALCPRRFLAALPHASAGVADFSAYSNLKHAICSGNVRLVDAFCRRVTVTTNLLVSRYEYEGVRPPACPRVLVDAYLPTLLCASFAAGDPLADGALFRHLRVLASSPLVDRYCDMVARTLPALVSKIDSIIK
jgi:hypothetical protein